MRGLTSLHDGLRALRKRGGCRGSCNALQTSVRHDGGATTVGSGGDGGDQPAEGTPCVVGGRELGFREGDTSAPLRERGGRAYYVAANGMRVCVCA